MDLAGWLGLCVFLFCFFKVAAQEVNIYYFLPHMASRVGAYDV